MHIVSLACAVALPVITGFIFARCANEGGKAAGSAPIPADPSEGTMARKVLMIQ